MKDLDSTVPENNLGIFDKPWNDEESDMVESRHTRAGGYPFALAFK